MTNKFIAILLIVMVTFADATPLLRQWSFKRQQQLKSGKSRKSSLQDFHNEQISIQAAPGGHGRKLSSHLSTPIGTVVTNLVAGSTQEHIICKRWTKHSRKVIILTRMVKTTVVVITMLVRETKISTTRVC